MIAATTQILTPWLTMRCHSQQQVCAALSLAPRETAFDDRGHVAQAVSFAQAGIFLFPQLHIGSTRKSIPAQNVDGWVVGLNKRLGIVPAPIGAIFLVIFGDRFLSGEQGAMQL